MDTETRRQIKEALAHEDGCYILITCGEPSPEGKLQVEMTYECEPALAAYMLEGAQDVIEEQLSF